MKTQMTDPKRYLLRMVIILLVTFGILALLYQPLASAFMGNAVLNGVIIATALIGVAFIFRQTLRLVPEARWLNTEINPYTKPVCPTPCIAGNGSCHAVCLT